MIEVREDMTGWNMWEHGFPDSRLTIIEQIEDRVYPNGDHKAQWLCECNCGKHNIFITLGESIRNGRTKSCGCIQKEKAAKTVKNVLCKVNRYDLSGDYGIGWTFNTGQKFYFDLEDYDKIKDYCWSAHTGKNGYTTIRARVPGESKHVIMSWIIVGDKWYDHINHNPLDNRKENLRKVTQTENNINRSVAKNNTSGITGISLNKKNRNWRSRIMVNGKCVELGSFQNKKDAIVARLQAEAKYFGEFAPQRHLFEQYNINIEGGETNDLS